MLTTNIAYNTPDDDSLHGIMKPEDVAVFFGKTTRWVYKNAAQLNGAKIGGSWIFTKEGISDAIQRGQEMARESNFQGAKVHVITPDKKRRRGLGGKEKKGAERSRKSLAERAGLAEFL
jgi:hypothetical protein